MPFSKTIQVGIASLISIMTLLGACTLWPPAMQMLVTALTVFQTQNIQNNNYIIGLQSHTEQFYPHSAL